MTTTHEQTARNAEIVQRRLAGEATGALALPPAMRFAMERAGLAQGHLLTLGEA